MNKKIISLVLIATLTASIGISSNGTLVKASTVPTNDITKNQQNNLKEIEQNYLIQNNDGTFSFKDSIYDQYTADTIDDLVNGMTKINKLILKGYLEFKINETGNVVNTK